MFTDYRKLSDFHKERVDKLIKENIEPEKKKNEHSGFEWTEPDYTLEQVHAGNYCAECWMPYHNCLCSHD